MLAAIVIIKNTMSAWNLERVAEKFKRRRKRTNRSIDDAVRLRATG